MGKKNIFISHHQLNFDEEDRKKFVEALCKEVEFYNKKLKPAKIIYTNKEIKFTIKEHDLFNIDEFKKILLDTDIFGEHKYLGKDEIGNTTDTEASEEKKVEPLGGNVHPYELPYELKEGNACCELHDNPPKSAEMKVGEPKAVALEHPCYSDIVSYLDKFMKEAERSQDYDLIYKLQSIFDRINRYCNNFFNVYTEELGKYLEDLNEFRLFREGKLKMRNTLTQGVEKKIGRKKDTLFVSDEAISKKDEKLTAEQATVFRDFLAKNGWNTLHTSASRSSNLNIAIFAFIRYWKNHGILASEHIVSANAIYRFLTEDCKILKDATIKSFNNVFCKDCDIPNEEMDLKVADFFNNK